MRLGIVTCDKCPSLIAGEKPLIPLLRPFDVAAEPVVWNDHSVDWSAYGGLLVRSIWDYHLHRDAFLSWLNRLEQMQMPVWNPVSILRWNHHKFYLRDLASRGVRIAPTLFFESGEHGSMKRVEAAGWSDVVIKPAVSASGYRTHAFALASTEAHRQFEAAAAHGDYLVQPFLPGIQNHGEVSMIFFNGKYSHAVLKRPRQGEFRVQREHGGHEVPYTPQPEFIRTGEVILERTGMTPLYARVDGMIDNQQFVLMELELIEPDLFLETAPGAVNRFADAWLGKLRPSASW